MALNELVTPGDLLIIVEYLERDAHILHLLGNSILPVGVTIVSINADGILGVLGNLNPKLLILLGVGLRTSVDLRNDAVTLLEDSTNPPVEGRLIMNILGDGILSCLNRIAFFDVGQLL